MPTGSARNENAPCASFIARPHRRGCGAASFEAVRQALEAAKIPTVEAKIDMIPGNYVTLDEQKSKQVMRLLEVLDDHEDTQNVCGAARRRPLSRRDASVPSTHAGTFAETTFLDLTCRPRRGLEGARVNPA
jgi:hypothetical protein